MMHNKAVNRSRRSRGLVWVKFNSGGPVTAAVRLLGPLKRSVDSGADQRYNGAMETSDGN